MTKSNVGLVLSSAVGPLGAKFCVTATKEIVTPRRTIYPGQQLIIDPDIDPAIGKMVLCGNRCELWDGQEKIDGVVVLLTYEV